MHHIGWLSVSLGTGTGRSLDGASLGEVTGGALPLSLVNGWEGARRQLASELVQQELAAGLLEVLLAHGGASLEACVDKGGRARHDLGGVGLVSLVELLIYASLVLRVKRGDLSRLAVEKLASHTGLPN